MTRPLDLGDLPALLAGSRLPDHLRDTTPAARQRRPKVLIDRTRSGGLAKCDQCGGPGRQWTRERARQHAADRGHTVRFVIEDTTTYIPVLETENHD